MSRRDRATQPGAARNELPRVNPASRSYLNEVAQQIGRENAITSSGKPIPGSSFADKALASA